MALPVATGFPVADWQFWTVTFAALLAAWQILRPFLGRGAGADGPCAGCALAPGATCGRRDQSVQLVSLGRGRDPVDTATRPSGPRAIR